MKAKIKILIVENDKQDIELLHHELEIGGINYVSLIVQNEKEYSEAILKFIPDIILCDYTFPSFVSKPITTVKYNNEHKNKNINC